MWGGGQVAGPRPACTPPGLLPAWPRSAASPWTPPIWPRARAAAAALLAAWRRAGPQRRMHTAPGGCRWLAPAAARRKVQARARGGAIARLHGVLAHAWPRAGPEHGAEEGHQRQHAAGLARCAGRGRLAGGGQPGAGKLQAQHLAAQLLRGRRWWEGNHLHCCTLCGQQGGRRMQGCRLAAPAPQQPGSSPSGPAAAWHARQQRPPSRLPTPAHTDTHQQCVLGQPLQHGGRQQGGGGAPVALEPGADAALPQRALCSRRGGRPRSQAAQRGMSGQREAGCC
jgi:hypothetical protein